MVAITGISLPERIDAGVCSYEVRLDEHLTRVTNVWARIDWREAIISLAPNQRPDRMRAALLHECLHAVFDEVGLDCDLARINEDLEEQVINNLTGSLLLLLRRNPALVRFLLAEDEELASELLAPGANVITLPRERPQGSP